jgi:G3E family GTPase
MSAGWINELEKDEEEEETEVDEYGISTFVYYRRNPLNYEKFVKYTDNFPKNIIRSKGIVYFTNDETMSYMFEQAGTNKGVVEAGLWLTEASEEERKMILENNPSVAKDWDNKYGDRMVKIVFIGQNMDKEKIIKELDEI